MNPGRDGLSFSRDANEAYVDALEFCLSELGSPVGSMSGIRLEIFSRFQTVFGGLAVTEKVKLANAREIWTYYRDAWAFLTLEEKRLSRLVCLRWLMVMKRPVKPGYGCIGRLIGQGEGVYSHYSDGRLMLRMASVRTFPAMRGLFRPAIEYSPL